MCAHTNTHSWIQLQRRSHTLSVVLIRRGSRSSPPPGKTAGWTDSLSVILPSSSPLSASVFLSSSFTSVTFFFSFCALICFTRPLLYCVVAPFALLVSGYRVSSASLLPHFPLPCLFPTSAFSSLKQLVPLISHPYNSFILATHFPLL